MQKKHSADPARQESTHHFFRAKGTGSPQHAAFSPFAPQKNLDLTLAVILQHAGVALARCLKRGLLPAGFPGGAQLAAAGKQPSLQSRRPAVAGVVCREDTAVLLQRCEARSPVHVNALAEYKYIYYRTMILIADSHTWRL